VPLNLRTDSCFLGSGLEVKPGRPATVVLEDGDCLLITQACLGIDVEKNERAVLVLNVGEEEDATVCTLVPFMAENVALDLPLSSEKITFSVLGAKKTSVHLLGRMVMNVGDDDDAQQFANSAYQALMQAGDDDDGEDDEDWAAINGGDGDDDEDEDEDEDDDDDDDDDDVDDDDDKDEDDETSFPEINGIKSQNLNGKAKPMKDNKGKITQVEEDSDDEGSESDDEMNENEDPTAAFERRVGHSRILEDDVEEPLREQTKKTRTKAVGSSAIKKRQRKEEEVVLSKNDDEDDDEDEELVNTKKKAKTSESPKKEMKPAEIKDSPLFNSAASLKEKLMKQIVGWVKDSPDRKVKVSEIGSKVSKQYKKPFKRLAGVGLQQFLKESDQLALENDMVKFKK